jgi:hypothetical protein
MVDIFTEVWSPANSPQQRTLDAGPSGRDAAPLSGLSRWAGGAAV